MRALLSDAQFRRVRTLWSGEIVSVAALVVSGLVVARALGATRYGEFALLSAYGALFYTFLEPRSGELVTKYFGSATATGRSRDALDVLRGVFALDLVALLLAVVVTVGLQPLVGPIAPGTPLDAGLAAALAALAGAVVTQRAVLAVLDRYRSFAVVQTVAALARAAATAAVAVLTQDVTWVLVSLATSYALELLVTGAVVARAVRARHGGRMLGRVRVSGFRAAAPGVGRFLAYSEATTLLGSLSKYSDTLVVGAVGGTEQAGLYRLARSLTAPVANLVLPLQTVTYNRFVSEHVRGGASAVLGGMRPATVVALPLAGLLLAATPLTPWVVTLVAGETFRGAGPVAVVLLLGAALSLPLYWLRPAFLVLDRLRTWLVVSVVTAALGTLGFLVGALAQGALGTAVARTLVLSLGANVVLLLLLRRGSAARARRPH